MHRMPVETKEIRLKKVPAEIHRKLKVAAATASKTLEDWIVDILRKATNGK